jgi:hypothetical protein
VVNEIFSGYQSYQLTENDPRFRDHFCRDHPLTMGKEMLPEMSVAFNQLTRLTARDDFIDFSRHESFRFYIKHRGTIMAMVQYAPSTRHFVWSI